MIQEDQASVTCSTDTTGMAFLPIGIEPTRVTGITLVPTVFYINRTEVRINLVSAPGQTINDRIARHEASPSKARALAYARQRLGRWVAQERLSGSALAALRLKAGLSQQQLADRVGMQQSNVSRFERAPGDPQLSTLQSWAVALNAPLSEVIEAVRATAEAGRE